MTTIRRNIYYYQISWLSDDDISTFKDAIFFEEIFDKICIVEKHDEYVKGIEKYIGLDYENWTFGIISKTKTKDFPLKQNLINHSLASLDLNENEGLYHPTHFAVYEGTVLLCEHNSEGFRVNSTLKNYINNYLKKHKEYGIKEIQIKPVLRKEVKKLLTDSKVRDIQISIAPGKLDVLKKTNGLNEMFNNINEFPDLTFNLGFSLGKRKSDKFYDKMDKVKNSFVNLLSKDNVDSLEKFVIKSKTEEGIETINLLDYFFKTNAEFLKLNEQSKAIDSKEAFESFKVIYNKHKYELDDLLIGDLNND